MILSDQYIAGFFDGEGCIASHPSSCPGNPLRVHITNTDKRVLIFIKRSILPGSKIYICKSTRQGAQKCYRIDITGFEETRCFLRRVLPYSIVKKEQILLALDFLGTKGKNISAAARTSIGKRLLFEIKKLKNQKFRYNYRKDMEV